ncbi:HAMP domain-containing histidine kinase [Agromyces protaetiae]|uniref:histidine kinase n=1 Tax=Agromyces protaetiae TaxID=2509455 RepID=A0A4P6FE79_9MICO|nr:HAMP domain-containing sensor histidine kinase [Agromyces protaetiae]QAY73313.1 HAMP domain-containing histidine kinase [Agromyces protaetiae]
MNQSLFERWNRISLRTKITGVTVLMLTLGLLVSGIGTAAMLRGFAEDQVESKLLALATSEKLGEYWDSSRDVFIAVYSPDGQYQSDNWSDRPAGDRPRIPRTLTQVEVLAQNEAGYVVQTLDDIDGHAVFRAVMTLQSIDDHGTNAAVLIAISTRDNEQLLAAYLTIFLGFGLGVILVGALLTRMLVTSTFTPLREVEATAAAIADGDFSQRLTAATPNTEVGRLTRSLNTMLNRIDRAFRDRARTIDQMRRFVGDASHELRTPLVSVRGYAELYRMGALQTPQEVAQAMDRIEKEAIRMGGLVEDLLALARLDEAKPLELAEVDLVPLARDAALDQMAAQPLRKITVIAPEDRPADASGTAPVLHVELEPSAAKGVRGSTIAFAGATLARLRGRRVRGRTGDPILATQPIAKVELDAAGLAVGPSAPSSAPAASAAAAGAVAASAAAKPEPTKVPTRTVRRAVVLAEENKIRQVITNLMGNAVRFTADDSPLEIQVSVDDEAEQATIAVVDHGEGIPPQIREKIFQRFWRADTSRARETGGSGLGLAIVSSIVAAHNGSVDVVETPGGGATFRVTLPLAGSAAAPQSVTAG